MQSQTLGPELRGAGTHIVGCQRPAQLAMCAAAQTPRDARRDVRACVWVWARPPLGVQETFAVLTQEPLDRSRGNPGTRPRPAWLPAAGTEVPQRATPVPRKQRACFLTPNSSTP